MGSLHAEFATILSFFTRLPGWIVGGSDGAYCSPDMARASRLVPLVGVLVGVVSWLTALAMIWIGLPMQAAAIGAIVSAIAMTGALHEDGLADVADALGAATPARRLDIMRDSRIGSYGAIALWGSLSMQAVLLATMATAGAGALFAGLVAAHTGSRTAALYLPFAVAPARADGASAAFGRPDADTYRQCVGLAVLVGGLPLLFGIGLWALLCGIVAAGLVALVMARFARVRFGGQTGDLIGATQQLGALALLAIVAIFV